MSEVTGLGTSWNLPNFAGELFTADSQQTPLLSMIGGLTGGKQTNNSEFATAVLFNHPQPKQPDISETASATAPTAKAIARKQETNVTQIHQEVIDLTYAKLSNTGRLTGISDATQGFNIMDEKTWQIQQSLITIARDVEHSFINGKFQKSTSADVANKTRGIIELTKSDGGNNIVASGELTLDTIKALLLKMANGGAKFSNAVLFAGAKQKQKLTALYEKQLGYHQDPKRNIGGVNISEIETDFCRMGVVWDRFVPDDTIVIADVAYMAPVFQVVPGKGVFFEEPLAKTGASERSQLYGQIGLDHGAAFLHGSITGLA